MPRQVRQLRADLKSNGFMLDTKRGKGSHTWWVHPSGARVNIAGHDGDDGDDAKPYQERQVRDAIHEAQRRQQQKGNRP